MIRDVTIAIAFCAWCVIGSVVIGGEVDFNSYWHDGQAELDGYRFRATRYGQRRQGQAVLVYVTEPFSRAKGVKVDDPSKNPADTFEAFKLNLIRDFQTGIYDYNTMVSVFTRSDNLTPVKITFSSAEWCGHVYEQLRFEPRRVVVRYASYFEDESTASTMDRPATGVAEDNLFILLRGLRGPFLEPGQKRSVPFLPSAFYRRLNHVPLDWSTAQIERLRQPQTVKVPAGTFSTTLYVVSTAQGRVGRFFVEQSYPHRIVQWTWQGNTHSESQVNREAADWAQLTGTARLSYWTLHDNGHEKVLGQLGLNVPHIVSTDP